MPRVSVLKECGHYVRIGVSGTPEARAAVVRDQERGRCFECIKLDRVAALQKLAEDEHLPELRGTPRQILWAEQIRRGKLDGFEVRARRITSILRTIKGKHAAEAAELVGYVELARQAVRQRARAAFWIDNQNADILSVGLHAVIPHDATDDPTHAERWMRRMQWISLGT